MQICFYTANGVYIGAHMLPELGLQDDTPHNDLLEYLSGVYPGFAIDAKLIEYGVVKMFENDCEQLPDRALMQDAAKIIALGSIEKHLPRLVHGVSHATWRNEQEGADGILYLNEAQARRLTVEGVYPMVFSGPPWAGYVENVAFVTELCRATESGAGQIMRLARDIMAWMGIPERVAIFQSGWHYTLHWRELTIRSGIVGGPRHVIKIDTSATRIDAAKQIIMDVLAAFNGRVPVQKVRKRLPATGVVAYCCKNMDSSIFVDGIRMGEYSHDLFNRLHTEYATLRHQHDNAVDMSTASKEDVQ